MTREGYGGRGSLDNDPLNMLGGLIDYDIAPDGAELRTCGNPRCGEVFLSRQDGDLYCSESCDIDSNPRYKARGMRKV